ncbi:hypothetical protein CRG98_015118 [Punica granatum]|uniref:Uncharacterized protein n=1 Tax=Punica granatum TaxID=22663 RepID=A0A2I0K7H1_PUNGR|nr:hypothetical protein CRG98_015118 [Punica granatum]
MGRGRQLATPTPPPRPLASSVGTGYLGGGVKVADWRPQSPNRPGTQNRSSQSICRLRLPIGDPDPSIEISGDLCGYRRPLWRG